MSDLLVDKPKISKLRHSGRVLYIEYLPDDFIVYKRRESHAWFYRYTDGIPAKNAMTSCCQSRPVKYFPDAPEQYNRWWLICVSCKFAISANGDVN